MGYNKTYNTNWIKLDFMKRLGLALFLIILCNQSSKAQEIVAYMSLERGGHKAVIFQDSLFVFGGADENRDVIPFMEHVDLESNIVTRIEDTSSRLLSTKVVGEYGIYAFGGIDDIFTPTASTFSQVYKNGKWSPIEPLPGPFASGKAVKVGNKIVLAGGNVRPDSINKHVYIYDELNDTWEIDFLSVPRSFISMATDGSAVWIIGGQDDSNIYDRIDIYDPVAKSWSTDTLPHGVAYSSAIFHNDKFYVAGGYNVLANIATGTPWLQIFDGNSWKVDTLNDIKAGIESVALGDEIYFIGGGPFIPVKKTFYDTYLSIDIYNSTTGVLNSNNLSVPRVYHSSLVYNNCVYTFGGLSIPNTGNGVHVAKASIESLCPYVGIEDLSEIDFSFYPNPCNSIINVEGLHGITSFEIYDNIGMLVLSGELIPGQNQLDVSALNSGIHFLRVGDKVERLLVE